jgi:modulator of FtsH protease HflK
MRYRIACALTLALAGYLATGLAVVQQDEVCVVRRFGAALEEPWQPGLHWGLPWGLDRLDRVQTGQTRTLTVGAQSIQSAPLSRFPNPESDDFLTGDLNLVTAQAVLQYRVSNPAAYLFSARSVDGALALAAESALTRALTERGVDDVLTTGRAEVAARIERAVQELADREGLGISVRAVRLGRIAPPVPVAPAFADADRARSDRRQAVTRAEEYRDRAQSDARGQGQEIADRAQAQHDRATQLARGESDRFAKVLAESRKAPMATRRRLYLETVAELLPRFRRKVVVAPGKDIDLSLFADEPKATAPLPEDSDPGARPMP